MRLSVRGEETAWVPVFGTYGKVAVYIILLKLQCNQDVNGRGDCKQ
jgi:hypothetical protein